MIEILAEKQVGFLCYFMPAYLVKKTAFQLSVDLHL